MLAVHFLKTRMEIMLVMTNLTNNYAKRRKIYQSLHFASVYTPCCLLLGVVAQSLKPVKLLRPQIPTFLLFRDYRSVPLQCCIRLHFCTALPSLMGPRTCIINGFKVLSVVSIPQCTAGPNLVGELFLLFARSFTHV